MTSRAPAARGRIARRFSRAVSSLVYREIDVAVDPSVRAGGPIVLVANHFGGLADGVLLVDALPTMPRVVARDVIWRIPVLGQIARAAGGIPVHQRADGAKGSNDQMFASCYAALRDGDAILIFPEGVTQDLPHIAPVKTGAARIALGARASGVPGVRIVPVGLHYEDKAVFRSRVLVNVGPPLDLDAWAEANGVHGGADDHEAVDGLTAQIDGRLRAVAPDFPDWETAHAYTAAGEIPLHDVGDPTVPLRYGDTQLLASRLQEVDHDRAIELAAGQYREALARAKTSDETVARHGRRQERAATQAGSRDLLLSLLLLPYAAIGLVVGLVPWLLVQAVRLVPAAPAVRATMTPALAALAFGVEWVAIGWRMYRWDGTAGLATAVLLFPLFIAATVFVAERVALHLRRRRAARLPSPPDLADLERRREELSRLIEQRL